MPGPDPTHPEPASAADLEAVTIGAPTRVDGQVRLADYDPAWAESFEREASRMEAGGYRLRIREAAWHEHRLFKGPDADLNLHLFREDCPEIDRMLAFRDRLRTNVVERDRYAAAKRDLAAREWSYLQHYADAKSEIVEAIIARAFEARRRARSR